MKNHSTNLSPTLTEDNLYQNLLSLSAGTADSSVDENLNNPRQVHLGGAPRTEFTHTTPPATSHEVFLQTRHINLNLTL